MTRDRHTDWALSPAEVLYSCSGVTRRGRAKAAQSRALDVTEATITLRHEPTGIEVRASIPPGHYARTRMRQMKDDLRRRLFTELEQRVARHLRIPGR
jgi:hypothetical protein